MPFLHIFLHCWPDPSGVESSVRPFVNFGGFYTGSYLHVTNIQITFCFILVPFYPLYCCCVGGNVDSKSSFSNCNRINLCFFESSISACESLKKLDKVRFLAVMILKKSLRS